MVPRLDVRGCLVMLAVCAMLVAGPSSICARTEAVLSWDDGEPEAYCGYPEAVRVVVWFQAPEWATSFVAMHVWFAGEWSPPFTMWLFRPCGEWPYEPGAPAGDFCAPAGFPFPGGVWTALSPLDPVDITDPERFPDRVFFAGIGFETQDVDVIGVDTDDPVDGKSLMWNGTLWEPYVPGDIMIRAVVSDSAGTVVEAQTWGGLKAMYGGSRLPN